MAQGGWHHVVPIKWVDWIVWTFKMNTIYMIKANWVIIVDIYTLFLKLMCIQTPYEYELEIAFCVVVYRSVIVPRLV